MSACFSPSYEVGDAAPHCTTRVAQSSSCHREKPVLCSALLPRVLVRTNRVSRQSFQRGVSIGSSPFPGFTCVGFRQPGRSPTAEAMRTKYLKTFFSCVLRKTWQPSSFLHHCCQVHAGCQTHTLLKQDYRSKSIPVTTLQAV